MPRSFSRPALVIGDFVLLLAAVPVTLTLRDLGAPTAAALVAHLLPFSLLALVFIAVFFSAGLYDPITALVKRELPSTIFGTQLVNVIIAALFFFFVPIFGITPKTNLFIYLLVSVAFVSVWHLFAPSLAEGEKETAIIAGDGPDVEALIEECKSGSYALRIQQVISIEGKSSVELTAALAEALKENPAYLLANPEDDRMQTALGATAFRRASETSLINLIDVYEELFRKIPLSSLSHSWFLSETSPERILYIAVKRIFDIVIGAFLSLLFLILIPFVWLALRIEGEGPLFIRQQRIGRGGSTITVLKFRTMTANEQGAWIGESKNRVTRVGAFLRKTSLDELPQVFSVFTGALSLIGPRSDIAALGERLAEAIPFYMLRYAVTPGISGWAQVNQRYSPGNISPQSIEESRIRLAYDLYYVKHRSPLLDLSIALRTLKTLITRWFA